MSECTLVSAGTYADSYARTTDGEACPTGYYCEEGTTQPTPCPAGTYESTGGADAIADCI